MKRLSAVVLGGCCTLAQQLVLSATPAAPAATAASPPGVRYIQKLADADLGAQIRGAVASLGPEGGVVWIRRGAYTWKSTVVIDPRKISLRGEGATLVSIDCVTRQCLVLNEPKYSIDQGGVTGGFALHGNGSNQQIGLEAGGVIGEQFDDIVFSGFTGVDSVGLLFNNSAAGNGWMERTLARKMRFESNTKGWEFKYNTRNPAAGSFGYSDLEAQCYAVKGQSCIVVSGGALYHSRIQIFGNVDEGGTLISVPGATSGIDEVWSNVYQVFAEGHGTGLNVGKGAQFTGYGVVDFGGMPVINANPPSYSGRVRVVQGPTETVNGDGGDIGNFLGTPNNARFYPVLVRDQGTPVAGFGLIEGRDISSAYVSIYGGAPNAFEVLKCPFKPSDLSECPAVERVDASGNVRASGAFYAGGSDYAESVSTVAVDGAHYEPGDVLTIDANSQSRFRVSGTPYSTTVAGVYSTRPGVLGSTHPLASAGSAEIPLAIHGIVPCKVSAENGAVHPGDLLVSAATPGFAMKGTDRNRMLGAVLGKSLAAVDRGTAVVPVLVTLQ
jgi:hypothetical protein